MRVPAGRLRLGVVWLGDGRLAGGGSDRVPPPVPSSEPRTRSAVLPPTGTTDSTRAATPGVSRGADLLESVERHCHLTVVAEARLRPLPESQPAVEAGQTRVTSQQQYQPADREGQVGTVEERTSVPTCGQEEGERECQPARGCDPGGQADKREHADRQFRHGQEQSCRRRMAQRERSYQPADGTTTREPAGLRGESLRPGAQIRRRQQLAKSRVDEGGAEEQAQRQEDDRACGGPGGRR
jgi:hypothetical protein